MAIETVGIQFKVDDLKLKNHLSQSIRQTKQLQGEQQKLNNLMRQEANFGSKSATDDRKALDYMRQRRIEQEKFNRALSQQKKYTSQTMTKSPAIKTNGVMQAGMMGGMMKGLMPMIGTYIGLNQANQALTGVGNRQAGITQIGNMLGRDVTTTESQDIKNVANESGQSYEATNNAIYSYISAFGGELKDALSFAKEAGISATGGGGDIGQTLQAMIKLKSSAPELTDKEITQAISGGVQVGNLTQEQLSANAGKFLSQSLKGAGMKLDEAMVLFGSITKSLSPEESATAMKGLSKELSDPTKEADKLGINKKTLETEGMAGIIKRLEGQDVYKIFGSEEARTAVLNMTSSVEEFDEKVKAFNNANPAEQFARANDDILVQKQRFENSINDFSDKIMGNEKFLTAFEGALQGVIPVVEGLGSVIVTVAGAINGIGSFFGEKFGEKVSDIMNFKNVLDENKNEELQRKKLIENGKESFIEKEGRDPTQSEKVTIIKDAEERLKIIKENIELESGERKKIDEDLANNKKLLDQEVAESAKKAFQDKINNINISFMGPMPNENSNPSNKTN